MNTITLTLYNNLRISGAGFGLLEQIEMALTIPNPQWLKNQRAGRYNGNTPKNLRYYRIDGDDIIAPRGFMKQAYLLGKEYGAVKIEDQRLTLPEVEFAFTGKLRDYQDEACGETLKRDFAIIISPTASGKTIIGSYLIAKRRQPALVIVPNKRLLYQWVEEAAGFLAISPENIGIYGDGYRKLGKSGLTIGIINTVAQYSTELAPHIGNIIVDECHHAASPTWRQALSVFMSKYMTGMTATLERSDGTERVVSIFIGETVHKVDPEKLKEDGYILDVEPIYRSTGFNFGDDKAHSEWKKRKPVDDPLINDRKAYSKLLKAWKNEEPITASNSYVSMMDALVQNPPRNRLIVQDVIAELGKQNGNAGVCLVLSERIAHCEALSGLLQESEVKAAYLHGKMPEKAQKEVVSMMKRGEIFVVAATGQMVGEGFDCKRLSSLFVATPIKFSGRMKQYLGRVMRPDEGKEKPRVYDYVDSKVGVLRIQGKHRRKVYEG